MYNNLLDWVKYRFFTSRIKDSLTHTFTMDYFTTEDKPEEPKINKGVLLTQGGLIEYVGFNLSGVYEITYLDLDTSGGIAEARRISDGKMISVYCGNDGYYNGPSPIYRVGIFKPIKNIKEFKL
tara:strand:+ start:1113 stop:1484 length:372 start_codon:yes stop_codon:yes gene_type:complete